ncbi:MAG: outer membrane protein assembly factor BamA [Deferribacteraceae bacterium]|jgi:outer membrane protein insertion porin family|nr:outer membrane protein assembly factor BamA [Deferribacteraceae bacterium]
MLIRVFILILLLCSSALAVTIDRVDITGNKRVPEDRIRPYLVLAGSEFNPDVVSTSISQLHETGYFLEISVDASVVDNSFVVTYILQETPLIAAIRIEGRDKLSEQKILETIATKVSDPLNFTHIGSSMKAIQTLYDNEKLYNAKIGYELEYLSETSVNVIFTIEEGEPSKVYNIWFYGNANVSDTDLKAVMQTKEKDFWSVMNASGMLMRDMLEYDRELVRQHYLSLGYATVEVSEAQIDTQSDPARMNYLLRINEGQRYTISSVSFSDSLGKFSQEELASFTGLKVDQYFNATQYRQDILALTNKYTELGYAHANVEPMVQLNHDAGTVSIAYNITEGELYTINRIEFTGNHDSRDNVMRREFDIMEGDLYNSRLINEGRRNMMVTSFFTDVRISERPTDDGNAIDLIVDVDEAKNGSINFAMSYSSNDGMVGRIEFAQANLFGFGSTLKLFAEMQLEGERQDYEISYTEPWIFDRPYSFNISGYSREREYTEYTQRSQGGAFGIGHQPIKRRLFLNYMISQETVDIYEIGPNASQYLLDEAGKTKIIALTPSITYSNVNSNLDPSDGFKASLRFKYAGTFLGGDVDYMKLTGEASYFQPLPYSFGGVLHAEAGQMWAIDDSRLPIDDRFFLGGIYSVRGYRNREISPKDANGYSYGGDKYYMFNAEMWRPIFSGTIDIRAVLFFDMGQVFDFDENFASADPRMAVGGGVRLFTPMGLLRLEMGYKLMQKEGEEPYEIEFAIGNVF